MLIDSDDKLDDLPPEIVITASEKPNRQVAAGGEYGNLVPENEEDFEFKMKTDAELKILFSKKKTTLKTVGNNLRDKGEKLRADIRHCKAELERRRKKNTSNKEIVITASEKPNRQGAGGEYGNLVPENEEDFEFKMKTDAELKILLSKKRTTLVMVGHNLQDKGEKLRADIHLCEAELERRINNSNKQNKAFSNGRKKHKLDMDIKGLPGMRTAKRASEKDKMDAFVTPIAGKEEDLANGERYNITPIVATSSKKDEFSVSDCMLVLNITPSVSTNTYNKALHHFIDVTWRKIFMLMPEDRRKGWLDSLDN